ncbi:hypothetical protein SBA1_320022 [Candidatus Sulfotelmatobacter kueseliae]|uniref:Uncharacterized protein n=1 Tax=Candidatus Sulfotelmatobacter kueseliae TaxID=2042962 RepID=A0A2U3KM01_9BACT|nr:hypothetical protein SBA1_320022 [Candidatus Sulfotelmatobacter kueseliae]
MPVASATTLVAIPVCVLVTTTCTSATRAPLESVIVPRISPVFRFWANSEGNGSVNRNATNTPFITLFNCLPVGVGMGMSFRPRAPRCLRSCLKMRAFETARECQLKRFLYRLFQEVYHTPETVVNPKKGGCRRERSSTKAELPSSELGGQPVGC